ncbi:MAG TPA: hypothetical protein VMU49_06175 [Candidatus Acidoferrales bacterium]|nr:hypothetical protein [Candidatus Acidoferrales bacterium]
MDLPAPLPIKEAIGSAPWFFALAAIFLLIWATSILANLMNPIGRAQAQAAVGAGAGSITTYGAVFITLLVLLSLVHAVAYYGLRAGRKGGWITATVLAAIWCLILVGIPVLIRLSTRSTRRAFGIG